MSDPATKDDIATLRSEIAAVKIEFLKWMICAILSVQAIIAFVLLVAPARTGH
jgi:hypothetical protein